MKIFAPAKINLALDVFGKTASGYHKIQTVFHEIKNPADEIELTTAKDKDIIKNKKTLAYKALLLVKKEFKIKKFAKITIEKKIPYSAGLGGDSSDAAAVLKGLNKLWNLKLSTKKLLELAENLGMDVPFFIIGGTALGTNRGEKITPLPKLKNIKFKIDPPKNWPKLPIKNLSKKTARMYASLDLKKCGKNKAKTALLVKAIKKQDKEAIPRNLHNDFETLVKPRTGHHLSGSGPATYTFNRQGFTLKSE